MNSFKILSRSVLLAALLLSQLALAISTEMQDLVKLETQANAVAVRSNEMVPLQHYEIPLDLVEKNIASRSNPQFVRSMIFRKNGKSWVRWLINPEDTKWHKEVEKFLIEHKLPITRYTRFRGYMTASRSYIAVDPISKAEFSIKMSTDKTGGNWRDKKQDWEDASQIRIMTDFVHDLLKNQPRLQHSILLDEPMAFGIKALDQAMVLRSYEDLSKSGLRYIPGFSIMHEAEGAKLAALNGSDDPAAFWNEHYNKPLARALAEFFLLTGMTYDSPHSQNFLVELDANSKPTGRIVLRDFGDTYLSREFFEAVGRTDILDRWEQKNIKHSTMPHYVGILHGNKAPAWMKMDWNDTTKNSYHMWGQDFFAEHSRELTKQSGIVFSGSEVRRQGEYISRNYVMNDSAAEKFFRLVKEGKQRQKLYRNACRFIFQVM